MVFLKYKRRGKVDNQLVNLNSQLRAIADQDKVQMIGSTVATLLAHGQFCVCQWAGDSRIYRVRSDVMELLTQDHALVAELVEKGILSPAEALGHPQSNLVTRALGASDQLYLDAEIYDLAHGDYFILCSDGLNKALSEQEILQVVRNETVETMSDVLVETALHRGARDNVTVICVEVFRNTMDSISSERACVEGPASD